MFFVAKCIWVPIHIRQEAESLSGDLPMGGLTRSDVDEVMARARQTALQSGLAQPEMTDAVRDAICRGAVSSVTV